MFTGFPCYALFVREHERSLSISYKSDETTETSYNYYALHTRTNLINFEWPEMRVVAFAFQFRLGMCHYKCAGLEINLEIKA